MPTRNPRHLAEQRLPWRLMLVAFGLTFAVLAAMVASAAFVPEELVAPSAVPPLPTATTGPPAATDPPPSVPPSRAAGLAGRQGPGDGRPPGGAPAGRPAGHPRPARADRAQHHRAAPGAPAGPGQHRRADHHDDRLGAHDHDRAAAGADHDHHQPGPDHHRGRGDHHDRAAAQVRSRPTTSRPPARARTRP